jgi:hypothetical protein
MTSGSDTRCARGTNRSGTDGKVRVVTAPTDFYLYFPSESDALAAGSELRARGYDVVVRLGADDQNWLVLASRVISRDELDQAGKELSELAESLGGEFDGFERPTSASA